MKYEKSKSVIEAIKLKNDILAVAEDLGFSFRKQGKTYRSGSKGSFAIYPESQRFKDFEHGFSGDVIDLVAHSKYDGNKRAAIRELCPSEFKDMLDKSFKEEDLEQEYISRCSEFLLKQEFDISKRALNYLHQRNITDEVIEAEKIGIDLNNNRIVIPFFDEEGKIVHYHTARTMNPDEEPRYLSATSNSFVRPCPLGLNTLKRDSSTLWLCEGSFDYLSLNRAGFTVLCTAGGTVEVKKVLRYVNDDYTVMLAFDNFNEDKGGKGYADEFAQELFKRHISFNIVELPKGIKDISDYDCAGGDLKALADDSIQGIEYLARGFIPQSNLSRIQERKLQSDLKYFLINAMRGGADNADIALLSNKLVEGGLPRNFIDAVIKKAENGETENEIAEKIRKTHDLIFNEKTGFYEYSENEGIWQPRTNTALGSYIKDYLGFKASAKKITAVISNLSFSVNDEAPIKQFNKLPLFVFRNGTFDVNSGRLREHSPTDYSTITLDYDYDENAKCDRWLQYIDEVTNGDKGRAAVLQEFAGYIFFPDCKFARILCLIGEGRNGKNICLKTFLGKRTALLLKRQNLEKTLKLYTSKIAW